MPPPPPSPSPAAAAAAVWTRLPQRRPHSRRRPSLFEVLSPAPLPYDGFQGEEAPYLRRVPYCLGDAFKTMISNAYNGNMHNCFCTTGVSLAVFSQKKHA
jgi:hypothetical protein